MSVGVAVGRGVDVGNSIAVGATVGTVVAAQADKKTEISPVNRTRRFILPPFVIDALIQQALSAQPCRMVIKSANKKRPIPVA
jgi:hypothetical protein